MLSPPQIPLRPRPVGCENNLLTTSKIGRGSKAFLARALDGLNSRDYDLASSLSEKLYLKSIIQRKLGNYPRTHSIFQFSKRFMTSWTGLAEEFYIVQANLV